MQGVGRMDVKIHDPYLYFNLSQSEGICCKKEYSRSYGLGLVVMGSAENNMNP